MKRNFGREPDLDYARDYGKSVLSRSPDQWLQPNANGSWSVMASMEAIFDRELSAAREKFIEERTKRFGGQANRAGRIALARYSVQLSRLREVKAMLEEALASAADKRSREAAEGCTAAEAALSAAREVAKQAMRRLPTPLQPWDAAVWDDWAAAPFILGLDDLYVGVPKESQEERALFGYCLAPSPELLPGLTPARTRDEYRTTRRAAATRHPASPPPWHRQGPAASAGR